MILILEWDGVVFDVAPACFLAHQQAAGAVGWSRLDQATFLRLMRKEGRNANFLPGAKPVKLKEYWALYDEQLEKDETLGLAHSHTGAEHTLPALTRQGSCALITLGVNLAGRMRRIESAKLSRYFARQDVLGSDPRRRPGELRVIRGAERRAIVVAAGDALVRAASQAEIFTVGIASGVCSTARLHQAGADVVYKGLKELAQSLSTGAADLIRAGLPPASLG